MVKSKFKKGDYIIDTDFGGVYQITNSTKLEYILKELVDKTKVYVGKDYVNKFFKKISKNEVALYVL